MGCTSVENKKWEKQEIVTQDSCFRASRYILSPQSEASHIELEILKTQSGNYLYINFLVFKVPCLEDDPRYSKVSILVEKSDPWVIDAYVLEGRQRLLFTEEASERLIQLIQDSQEFDISVGRETIHVLPMDKNS